MASTDWRRRSRVSVGLERYSRKGLTYVLIVNKTAPDFGSRLRVCRSQRMNSLSKTHASAREALLRTEADASSDARLAARASVEEAMAPESVTGKDKLRTQS